jgi:hypothetical protein
MTARYCNAFRAFSAAGRFPRTRLSRTRNLARSRAMSSNDSFKCSLLSRLYCGP